MLSPAELEKVGWGALLRQPALAIVGTDVLLASLYRRKSGLAADVLSYFTVSAVVISDKALAHNLRTWCLTIERSYASKGVRVRTTMKDSRV
jgi:hypothetical protein